jgi:hypothetical protein
MRMAWDNTFPGKPWPMDKEQQLECFRKTKLCQQNYPLMYLG